MSDGLRVSSLQRKIGGVLLYAPNGLYKTVRTGVSPVYNVIANKMTVAGSI